MQNLPASAVKCKMSSLDLFELKKKKMLVADMVISK